MEARLQALLDDLGRVGQLAAADRLRCARRAAWLSEAEPGDQREFLRALGQLPLPLEEPQEILLQAAFDALLKQRRREAADRPPDKPARAASLLPEIAALYRHLGPFSSSRGRLLAWLAAGESPAEQAELVELLVNDPPVEDADVVRALAPLFTKRELMVGLLFPRLLDALSHAPLAAAVLDLANHVCRRKLASAHPAADRGAQLQGLLAKLVNLLKRLEASPAAAGESPREISRRVQQSVALAVSLCDALALIGDPTAAVVLESALDLGHRRLRTEAAAALARLGQQRGKEELIQLAAEPVARLRVLAYADELGFSDEIEPQFRSPQARGESELTVWLSEPTQFGVPPQSCELIDHRRQFWPGFADPVDCFLFRFTYRVTVEGEERSFTSIGIAGPLSHAFTADLADLPPADIYAAFAGWQAEHAEIKEYEVDRLNRTGQTEVARLARRLHDAGYESIEPKLMGEFFGDKVLVACAEQGALSGVAVADARETTFFPARHTKRPIGVREAYCIYRGRRLLKAFNT